MANNNKEITMADKHDEYDEMANNLMAAGALYAVLISSQIPALISVDLVENEAGNATNQIEIGLEFLSSPYRITVERVIEIDEK